MISDSVILGAKVISVAVPDADQMRDALRRLPTGVVVVTTRVDGIDYAMTANSFTSVCLDPPLVLVCVQRDTQFHEAVNRSDTWAVSILARHHEPLARQLAHRGRPPEKQIEGVDVVRSESGLAVVADCEASLECRTEQCWVAGDHDIVLGAVIGHTIANHSAGPLVYWGRSFHPLASEGDAPR